MSIKQHFARWKETEAAKLRPMTAKQRAGYILHYYRFWFIGLALLLLVGFYVPPGRGRDADRRGPVIDVSAYPVVEDLYLAADVLLTDYSSAMFDYAVLDRPVVIFAPDWPVYRDIRGTYFDLLAEPPGAVATDYATLVGLFSDGSYADGASAAARSAFRARFCSLDDGHAAERVVRRVFLDDNP